MPKIGQGANAIGYQYSAVGIWISGFLCGFLAERRHGGGFQVGGSRSIGLPGGVLRNELVSGASGTTVLRNGRRMHRPYRIGFAAFVLELYQRVQGLVESALMGGLVAQEKGELIGIDVHFGKGIVLIADRALHEPPGLGHMLHQELFGFGSGRMLGEEAREQGIKIGGIFARDYQAAGSEAVFERVAAGDGFPFHAARSGGALASYISFCGCRGKAVLLIFVGSHDPIRQDGGAETRQNEM